MGESVMVQAATAGDRTFVELSGVLHRAVESPVPTASPTFISFCVGEDCSGSINLRERDVIAVGRYGVEAVGTRFEGLLVRLRGGGILSVEQDWASDVLTP